MRFLILTVFILNCLIFSQAEDLSPTTTLTSLSVENDIINDNIEIRNSIANKPFFTIAADNGNKPTPAERDQNDRKTSTTTNKPKLSVYALINAKKQTKKTKAGKCNCFGETSTVLRYIKVLNDDLELGDNGNLDCANPTDASNKCESLCREKVSVKESAIKICLKELNF